MGIGPSTKETTLHHFRDPLLNVIEGDDDLECVGVVIAGTPQSMQEKAYIASRIGTWLEAMRIDGAVVSMDGWGNSHVDFALTCKAIGKRHIPLVGITFIGKQASFVMINQYMNTIVDMNKSDAGIETECVGENTTNTLDAKKVTALLKLKMRG